MIEAIHVQAKMRLSEAITTGYGGLGEEFIYAMHGDP